MWACGHCASQESNSHDPFVSGVEIVCAPVGIWYVFRCVCTYERYLPFFISLSGCAGGGNADRIQKLRKEYHQARREGLPFYEDDEVRTQPSDYDQHWVGLQCAAKCACSIRGLQKMSICLYFAESLCQPNMTWRDLQN